MQAVLQACMQSCELVDCLGSLYAVLQSCRQSCELAGSLASLQASKLGGSLRLVFVQLFLTESMFIHDPVSRTVVLNYKQHRDTSFGSLTKKSDKVFLFYCFNNTVFLRLPTTGQDATEPTYSCHISCRVSPDKPEHFEFFKPYSVYRAPLKQSKSLPSCFSDSYTMQHPDLDNGQKTYLWHTASVYSMSNMKALQQRRYKQLLQHQVDIGG